MPPARFRTAARCGAPRLLPLFSAAVGDVLLMFCFFPVAARQLRATSVALPQGSPPKVAASPAPPPSAEEQFFFQAANKERSARGLREYQWNDALAIAARRHAALMAKSDELSHQLDGEPRLDERAAQAGARFSSVGENVAIGTDTPGIQNGWMHSPGHRDNILRPAFTALGVGVVQSRGEFYAVEDFSTFVENLTIEQQEERISALLKARGLRVIKERSEARKSCDRKYVPGYRVSLSILRLDTADLNSVAPEVERSLKSRSYHAAQVAACPPARSEGGIERFRIVILFFPEADLDGR
ncbi:MAG TPA: CAP domain-containing protein [Candidatus Acidoferrum sp.]|nr:CAP domain-containing protein [Candidatus Acidoferrum sp.]